jgi:hypothetical protein
MKAAWVDFNGVHGVIHITEDRDLLNHYCEDKQSIINIFFRTLFTLQAIWLPQNSISQLTCMLPVSSVPQEQTFILQSYYSLNELRARQNSSNWSSVEQSLQETNEPPPSLNSTKLITAVLDSLRNVRLCKPLACCREQKIMDLISFRTDLCPFYSSSLRRTNT